MNGRDGRRPLSRLLSQVLVAFTIELDNEFEHRAPHRTSTGPAAASGEGPWLASLAMWANFMRFVHEDGVPLAALEMPARLTNLNGLERWGYIRVGPSPHDTRPRPPRRDWIVRPTRKGRAAQEIWRPLPGEIEARWVDRFGAAEVAALRESLQEIVDEVDLDLPYYLPVLGHGMVTRISLGEKIAAEGRGGEDAADLPFYALLSQVLLAFTLEFERTANVSLALSANVLRVLDESGARRRDLPRLTGISKEAVSISLSFLEKHGYLTVDPDLRDGRTALVRLTKSGIEAQATYHWLVAEIEERWCIRFGKEAILHLRESLERLVGEPGASSPLLAGLASYPDGWRARRPMPETLPHYPMVLHRGGYPDGS